MLDKKDAQWWILEAQKHPESAADLIRMLADRLAFLDKQNEELRGEVITLRRRLRGSGGSNDSDALQRRVTELERALANGSVQRHLIIYGSDRIEFKQPYSSALPGPGRALAPECQIALCTPAAQLLILTADSRIFALSLDDLPTPPEHSAALLGNPRNVAALLDKASFEACRFLTVLTQRGYAYSVLAGTLAQVAGRQERLIRGLVPGDPVVAAFPSYNGDLFAISRKGRWTRFAERTLAGGGSQVMELPNGDTLAGLIPLNTDTDLVFVSEEGRILVRPSASLAARKGPGTSAGMLFRGQNIRGVATGGTLIVLTGQGRLLNVDLSPLSLAAQTENGVKLPGLPAGDSVLFMTAF